ncbi:uncharacterized protein J4E92_009526 [Alternaria infectoria]|uniref:uncharacterized protein n=1 Tax=Alternaria infectoria TaxID=45303 RepID=UPI00222129AA|nr:uncharacterized protein J4E92_009526 [Alternaria infectoria]KAI4914327.1 hypothetical protein J4E92_009526 [Alternaria infectoria]
MRFNNVAGLALGLAIPTGALSVPRNAAPEPAGKIVAQLFCDIVGGLVTVAKQQPQATSFLSLCQSYQPTESVANQLLLQQVPLTILATATNTDTATVTNTITNTATETSTVTERTTIITGTQQVIAIPTFTVYAIGGDNSGNPIADASRNVPNTVGNSRGLSPVLQFTTVDNNKLQVLNGPYAGSIGKTNPNVGASEAYVLFGRNDAGLQETVCQVTYNAADGTCPLSCVAARGTTSYDCGVYWRIAGDADVGGCYKFTPYAVGGP